MGRVLFIRGGAVGDFVVTMPAINLVRKSLPQVEIEILGYESIAQLAIASGIADRVRSIEHASMAPFFAPGAKLDEAMASYIGGFDVVISYLYDPDGFFSGNLIQAGVETLIEGPFRMSETEAIPASRQLAAPLEQLALFLEEPFVHLDFGSIEDGEPKDSTIIALHPGSGSPAKNWSPEGWTEICRRIREAIPQAVFWIVSGEAESETIRPFIDQLAGHALSVEHLDQMPLAELAKKLQRADLFLGHDSGISHLAAATGIEGLVLFGPSNPRIWAPQSPGFAWVEAPGKQMGNFKASRLWNEPALREKLESIS